MKNLAFLRLSLLFVLTLTLVACNNQSASDTSSTPVPTTAPLSAVEQAIFAANEQDYATANQLLDVSAVAQDGNFETVTEYWDWLTSNQRVNNVDIREEQTQDTATLLFIVLENEGYPTRNTGFWIRWQDDRWVAFNDEG